MVAGNIISQWDEGILQDSGLTQMHVGMAKLMNLAAWKMEEDFLLSLQGSNFG